MIVRNEEKNIERCLDSLQGVVDEIVLVHDGNCGDATLDIAKKHGARVFIKNHVGMMEAHLIFAIRQTKGDWVIRIDADEFLSSELRKDIRSLVVKAEKENISAYSFRWIDFDILGNDFISGPERKAVLFKKCDLYWFSLPHFAWQSRGKLVEEAYVLGHVISQKTWFKWLKGRKKWAKIQAKYLLKDFGDLDNFQAKREDWLKVYSFSRRHAKNPFLAFMKFGKTFSEELFVKKVGIVKSLKRGVYNFYLGYYLFIYSRKH